jgi:putative transposase
MNRGDRREAIFKDDQDRDRFLETLGETCAKTGWQVHDPDAILTTFEVEHA